MDRLFLDANVLFSAVYRADAGLLRLWELKNVVLCTSRYALEEARINLADEDQRMPLSKLALSVQLFDAAQGKLPRGIILPEKDVPILLAAIEARATHLLTGDIQHFGTYLGKRIEGVAIVLPGEYLSLLTVGGSNSHLTPHFRCCDQRTGESRFHLLETHRVGKTDIIYSSALSRPPS